MPKGLPQSLLGALCLMALASCQTLCGYHLTSKGKKHHVAAKHRRNTVVDASYYRADPAVDRALLEEGNRARHTTALD